MENGLLKKHDAHGLVLFGKYWAKANRPEIPD